MKRVILSAIISVLSAVPASGGLFEEDCSHKAVRTAIVPTAGVTRIVIDSGAGLLKIEGRDGATQVGVKGFACTNDKDSLDGLQVKTTRQGSDLRIETIIPEAFVFFGYHQAKIDLYVTLPPTIPLVIDDGSGSISVQNVGPLSIEDGSGSITVEKARGAVTIDDGSGSMSLSDIAGDIRITDGSGSISVRAAAGVVRVDADGSGSISIDDVKRDVIIDDDGSGSVSVAAVGGNLVVNSKGSGSISYDRISGKVTIPSNKR